MTSTLNLQALNTSDQLGLTCVCIEIKWRSTIPVHDVHEAGPDSFAIGGYGSLSLWPVLTTAATTVS